MRREDGIPGSLRKKIDTRKAKIGVLGLGYVGLPLALEFTEQGFTVIGFERDASKIKALLRGRSYVVDIAGARIKKSVSSGRLRPTGDFSGISACDAVIICVPTPLRKSKDPDLSYVLDASGSAARYFRKGQIIVLESTTYPGTTREVILKLLLEKHPGFIPGRDFFLAFSPERVDPANRRFNIRNTPKVIGGITPACTEAAAYLYGQAIDSIIKVSDSETAEMVKLLENTFRAVNIGLINEIALMCERLKVSVWEVVDAAKTKPYGFMPFYPGPGIGGHCIPLDPYYLSWKMKTLNFYSRFIELAGEINSKMPEYVVSRISVLLNGAGKCIKGSRILICGVAYKKNVSDCREAPAIDIIRLLSAAGAKVSYFDPFVPVIEENQVRLVSSGLGDVGRNDLTVIITEHDGVDYRYIARHSKMVYDTRNCLAGGNYGRKVHTL